ADDAAVRAQHEDRVILDPLDEQAKGFDVDFEAIPRAQRLQDELLVRLSEHVRRERRTEVIRFPQGRRTGVRTVQCHRFPVLLRRERPCKTVEAEASRFFSTGPTTRKVGFVPYSRYRLRVRSALGEMRIDAKLRRAFFPVVGEMGFDAIFARTA